MSELRAVIRSDADIPTCGGDSPEPSRGVEGGGEVRGVSERLERFWLLIQAVRADVTASGSIGSSQGVMEMGVSLSSIKLSASSAERIMEGVTVGL